MDLIEKMDRPTALWRQIAVQIRQKILDHSLPPGTKLPTTVELAEQAGADAFTVHRALTELVKEGLIVRTRKVGTFVAERPTRPVSIAIYLTATLQYPPPPHRMFQQAVHAELENEAHRQGIGVRTLTDRRPENEQGSVIRELEDFIHAREVDALVSMIGDPLHHTWMDRLAIPVAVLGSDRRRGDICFENKDAQDLALHALHRQGATSVGFIAPYFRKEAAAIFNEFLRISKNLGLETREEWIIPRERDSPFQSAVHHETFGYEAFRRLWNQKEKPDSLIAHPDTVSRGVILALTELGVKVPSELKLVLAKNDGIDYFCPFPASFVVSSPKKVAHALLRRALALASGKQDEPSDMKHWLEEPGA